MIACHVFAELSIPEATVRGGGISKTAPRVAVPEAAFDFNDRPIATENEVGSPWQPLDVKTESQSCAMQIPADNQLGPRILAANAGHHPASRGPADDVGQVLPRPGQ